MSARSGRGRLSSLDLIPEEGYDDIVWAMEQLNERRRSQADILFELNDRLEAKGIDPISKSAFNRAAIRTASAARRISEARAVFAGIAPQFTPESIDQNSIVLGEVIKTLILELTDAPGSTPKEAMELARAFLATIQGQKLSADRRRKLEADMKEQAKKAIGAVGAAQAISQEVQDQLYSAITGVPV